MLFKKIKEAFNPLANKKAEVRLVDISSTHPDVDKLQKNSEYGKISTPIVEEGIIVTKKDILTAVVVLTLVNGLTASLIVAVSNREND